MLFVLHARLPMLSVMLGLLTLLVFPEWRSAPTAGEPLPNIQCVNGYTATVYAQNLSGPDGLAIDSNGVLYVAQENSGEVSRIGENGAVIDVMENLQNPEGIAFDPQNNLYVVEDVLNGRLLQLPFNSATPVELTSEGNRLTAPEGVVWANGRLFVTESNVEYLDNELKTWVTEVTPQGLVRTQAPPNSFTDVRAYSGITAGADGKLYIANELAGATRQGFTLPANSVYRMEPGQQAQPLFATGLIKAEGLRFSPNGGFPLYVIEEENGRISRVSTNGTSSQFCTGFAGIEDVAIDANGRVFVSEDDTGRIILLTPSTTPPTATPTTTPKPQLPQRPTFLPLITN